MLTASTDFNFRVAGQTVDLDVQITAIAASLDTVANRMAIAELERTVAFFDMTTDVLIAPDK